MSSSDDVHLSDRQLSELARFADGKLDPRRRLEVEALISTCPRVRELHARQRDAVELLHTACGGERAPARLRAWLEAQRPPKRAYLRRTGYAGGLVGALAVTVVMLTLVFPGVTPGSPSVSQAAGLALRGATQPPPVPDPNDPGARLAQRVQGVYFPNWARTLGWRAVGQRSDVLIGRRAATVYYGWRGMLVAYTIVSRPALAQPSAPLRRRDGHWLQTITVGGRTVVTWRRAGQTCVLSAAGVLASVLERLAVWNASRA
jgi:anti-sigma factor RsiW